MSEALVIAVLNRLEAGQTTLHADLASVKEDVSSIRGELTSLQRSHATLQDNQTSLRVDVMARMDRLENRLTEIRDDISVNMGSTRRAHEAADNTRIELRSLGEQVDVMWRQMKRLEQQVRDITGDP